MLLTVSECYPYGGWSDHCRHSPPRSSLGALCLDFCRTAARDLPDVGRRNAELRLGDGDPQYTPDAAVLERVRDQDLAVHSGQDTIRRERAGTRELDLTEFTVVENERPAVAR